MPLSESHVFGVSWAGGAADSINDRPTFTGTAGGSLSFTLAGAVTDQEHDIGFDKDTLKGLVVIVSGNDTAVVTMETNAADHTGGQIFTFPIGGGRLFWDDTSPLANPVTDDVTKTCWTHAGTEAVDVKVRVLSGTP